MLYFYISCAKHIMLIDNSNENIKRKYFQMIKMIASQNKVLFCCCYSKVNAFIHFQLKCCTLGLTAVHH